MLHRTYKPLLHALFACLLALLAPMAHAEKTNIVLYPGYGTTQHFMLEGRIIEARLDPDESRDDSSLTNLKRTARRLINDEQAKLKVRVKLGSHVWQTKSDREGYFRIEAAAPRLIPGWYTIEAESGSIRAQGKVLLAPPENSLALISDLDDTILISNVTNKSQLLSNTLLKNYAQRAAVSGAAEYYAQLARRNARPEAAPIFYLSASPRQLHTGIQTFLDRNGFPPGVLITKKVTNDASGEPLLDQVRYKTAHIEQLLAEFPQMRFMLIGDDGEQDPEIYHDIHTRFPARIIDVFIRHVSPDSHRVRYPEQKDFKPTDAKETRS